MNIRVVQCGVGSPPVVDSNRGKRAILHLPRDGRRQNTGISLTLKDPRGSNKQRDAVLVTCQR